MLHVACYHMFPVQSSLEGVEETVSQIALSVPQLFTFAAKGLERCMQLTEGWGLSGLVKTLEVSSYTFRILLGYSQYTLSILSDILIKISI